MTQVTTPEEYERLADRAELASEELDVRQGRAEAGERPFLDVPEEELRKWSTWDPEQDPNVVEDLGQGITLRTVKRRSTARRRLQAEPEGEMPSPPAEARKQEPLSAAKPAAAPARPRVVKPAPPRRPARSRIALGGGLSQLIGALGVGLCVTGRDPGVGMALQFEAPIAGEALDRMVQGTPLDRIAQPLARIAGAGKEAGSVLALPFLVGLIERRPELYPVLKEPLLRPMVVDMAIQLEEAGQRSAARLAQAQSRGSGLQVDSDGLLAMLFEGRPPQPPASTPPADGG